MRRRLNREGEVVLSEWLSHYHPDEETRRLITEALEAFAGDAGQIRFHSEDDPSNPGVIVVSPKEGLSVHVQALGEEWFTLVRVIDARNWAGG